MLSLDSRYEEAEHRLAEAEHLFALAGTKTDLGLLRAEQATVAANRGDAPAALAYALETENLINDRQNERSIAWRALAVAHAASGNTSEAEANFKLALNELTERRDWRDASNVARELSTLLSALGRADEAYELLQRAVLLALRKPARS
jgi:tetratricopeptide (TPR) repeat protein